MKFSELKEGQSVYVFKLLGGLNKINEIKTARYDDGFIKNGDYEYWVGNYHHVKFADEIYEGQENGTVIIGLDRAKVLNRLHNYAKELLEVR